MMTAGVYRCLKCGQVMILQSGWVGDRSIYYEVCSSCGNIDPHMNPMKDIKEIEKKREMV